MKLIDKESLHSTEILKYQQTIKDQANSIYNLQKETQAYQVIDLIRF